MTTCAKCPYADRIKLLEGIILEGKKAPDLTWERAVEAAKRGDWEPFKRYEVPEEEEAEGGGHHESPVTPASSLRPSGFGSSSHKNSTGMKNVRPRGDANSIPGQS